MRQSLIFIPLALCAALLAGCANTAQPGAASLSLSPSSNMSGEMAIAPEYSMRDADSRAPASDGSKTIALDPQIITTVELTVTVTKPLTAADDAAALATNLGGSVSFRTERAATDTSAGSAQLTLRIPSANLDVALEQLKALGVAKGTSINSVDVGTEIRDLDARITSLETSVDRLLTLMSQATSTESLLSVESMLSQRQAELEGLKSQKRSLDNRVQLSTVNLQLVSEQDTPAAEPDTFLSGLITGWNAFVAFWAGVLVGAGVLAPWLIALAVLALIAVVWIKRTRRRTGKRTSASTAGTSEPGEQASRASEPNDSEPSAAEPGAADQV